MPRSLTSKEKPTVSQSKVKMDRRAASLRENLRKRKLQERARQKSSQSCVPEKAFPTLNSVTAQVRIKPGTKLMV